MGDIAEHFKKRLTAEDEMLVALVLHQWCDQQGIDVDSEEAAFAERDILQWFHFGIRKPKELLEIIGPL